MASLGRGRAAGPTSGYEGGYLDVEARLDGARRALAWSREPRFAAMTIVDDFASELVHDLGWEKFIGEDDYGQATYQAPQVLKARTDFTRKNRLNAQGQLFEFGRRELDAAGARPGRGPVHDPPRVLHPCRRGGAEPGRVADRRRARRALRHEADLRMMTELTDDQQCAADVRLAGVGASL